MHRNLEGYIHESRQIGSGQTRDGQSGVYILGISELKWTGKGEFNSDDEYIYDCGQESLRRNGIALIVNNKELSSPNYSAKAEIPCFEPTFQII